MTNEAYSEKTEASVFPLVFHAFRTDFSYAEAVAMAEKRNTMETDK